LIIASLIVNTTLPKATAGSIGDRCEELTRFQKLRPVFWGMLGQLLVVVKTRGGLRMFFSSGFYLFPDFGS